MRAGFSRFRTAAGAPMCLGILAACVVPAVPSRADMPSPGAAPYSLFSPTPDSQLRDMDTDRPNVTNTPHTVDAGHLQLEMGFVDYASARVDSAGGTIRNEDTGFGQMNLRLGILESLEVNALLDSYDVSRAVGPGGAAQVSGLGDATIGAKYNFWGNDGSDAVGATALALQPQFKIPTARHGIGNGRAEFSVVAPFLVNLEGGFHLGLQTGVSDERNSGNTGYVTGIPLSASVDRVVGGKLDVYLEYSAEPTTGRSGPSAQSIDFGGTWPATKNMVLDAGIALGLNRASNDVEVLAGVSLRR